MKTSYARPRSNRVPKASNDTSPKFLTKAELRAAAMRVPAREVLAKSARSNSRHIHCAGA
jgi:hypothetical protein